VQITGSNHIAADVHEFQAGVITAGDFAANSITASALAADAVTEIQSGLALAATALSTAQWTNTLATNIGTTNTTVATNLDATVSSRLASASYTAPSNLTAAQIATGVWQDATPGDFTTASSVGKSLYNAFTAGTSVFTVAALANAPSGGGGSATLANQTLILADLASITSALAATTVTVTGYASIDTDGVLQLKRAETATLTFTSVSSNLVPSLSVANTKVVLGIKDTAGRVWLSLEGTVLVPTGFQSVQFTLTPILSLALINGKHNFDVLAIYGYDASLTPPYATLKTFTSGRVTVTDVYLDPLEL
jgi:hypothetical protein